MGFLRKNPEGTHLGQISDAYPSVAADIAHLQKEVRPVASQRMACLIHGMGRCEMHMLGAMTVCLLRQPRMRGQNLTALPILGGGFLNA